MPWEPPEDVAAFVARNLGTATWRYRASVTDHARAEELVWRLPPGVDTPHMLAVYLGLMDADFEATEPPELVAELAKLADRYARAVGRTSA